LRNFWKNKRVLITGHTGFKGIWLSLILKRLGSVVFGYSLKPRKNDLFYKQISSHKIFKEEIFSNITNQKKLDYFYNKVKPDIVFHLAAQAIVLESISDPLNTYKTNVIGTLNVLEMTKKYKIKSTVLVTTDKCYQNNETGLPLKETDNLGGKDIYSSSKACCEILIDSYKSTYFYQYKKPYYFASVRAGNVIGGGDFTENRIIPDFFKALNLGQPLTLRNAGSVRPWQYIFDVLNGYLLVGEKIYKKKLTFDKWNFGPNPKKLIKVETLIKHLNSKKIKIRISKKSSKIESKTLILDSTRAKKYLNWTCRFNLATMLNETEKWYEIYFNKKSQILKFSNQQIDNFFLLK
jgi:CDP-glucose 4,6-dehydratase